MREIKFRAWDRKLNIMWEPIELKKLLSYLIFQQMPNATAYTEIKDHFNDIEWLEYTGLHDKNGKEIFEGDRVKCQWWGDVSGKTIYGTVEIIDGCADVVFDERQYDRLLKFHKERDYLKCFTVNHACEVIENRYEHPELLEGE